MNQSPEVKINNAQLSYKNEFLTPPEVIFREHRTNLRLSGNMQVTGTVSSTSKLLDMSFAGGVEKLFLIEGYGSCAYYKKLSLKNDPEEKTRIPHPKKGFPFPDIGSRLNAVKKTLLSMTYVSSSRPAIFFLAPLILSNKFIKKCLEKIGIEYMYYYLHPYLYRDEYLTKSVWAFKDAAIKAIRYNVKNAEEEDMAIKLIDVLCAILEWDNAYRYRFQDIIAEIKLDEFIRNPAREIARLVRILGEREMRHEAKTGQAIKSTTMVNKYNSIQTVLRVLLFLKPKLKRIMQDFGRNLKINEIRPDIDDWYWFLSKGDYNFGGVSFKARNLLLKELQKDKNRRLDEFIKEPEAFKQVYEQCEKQDANALETSILFAPREECAKLHESLQKYFTEEEFKGKRQFLLTR